MLPYRFSYVSLCASLTNGIIGSAVFFSTSIIPYSTAMNTSSPPKKSKPKPLISRYFRKLVRTVMFVSVALLAFGLGMMTMVYVEVWYGDHSKLEKTTILTLIEEESTLYYLDEKTQIGSLFDQNHRRYISIKDIPAHMQNAIIAAEDKNFYAHYGIDVTAIIKAFIDGVKRGFRFRRGGSTITQQTVKNIMQDWKPTFARKFREMIKAFQMEKLYNKKQILEFYLNQFHVAGNGSGISIAAKYYFNKAVMDLNLIEAAFIAGSLKSPSKYNPFMKRTKDAYNKAIRDGFGRKNYVLKRMFEQGWITRDEYDSAKTAVIPFEKGTFSTSEVTLLKLIKEQLAQKEVLDALGLSHPKELHTAGFKVFTTIDATLQKTAQRVTRRNLARLETILAGHQAEKEDDYKDLKRLAEGDFVFARITHITKDHLNTFSLELSLGLPTATIPNNSLRRYAKLLNLTEAHEQGYIYHLGKLMNSMKVGDIVFMEVKKYDKKNHRAVGELYRHPTIDGGAIALDKGKVRAVISGFDTLGFNRATQAKRQPGSVFKIPTLLAALQLGWTVLDRVHNQRQIFSYQGEKYYPRPDHKIRFSHPSLLWSGIMSENLAFIHLANHLLAKLSMDHFQKLLKHLDLAPRPKESSANYHYRVSRAVGVGLDTRGIKKQLLKNITSELLPDLIFSENTQLHDVISTLWWGDGYIEEVQKLYRQDLERYSLKELQRRISLTRNNFTRYQKLKDMFIQDWQTLELASQQYGVDAVFYGEEYQEILERFYIIEESQRTKLAYNFLLEEEEYDEEDNESFGEELTTYLQRQMALKKITLESGALPESPEEQEQLLSQEFERITTEWPSVEFSVMIPSARSLNQEDLYAIFESPHKKKAYFAENIYLDGNFPLHMIDYIEKTIPKNLADIKNNTEKYSLNQYFHHHDFRIGLGLYYLTRLIKILGAQSRINPVLSTPLGTNSVSAAEVAKIFQTFAQGNLYRFFEKGPHNQLSFIERIENRYGEVIYTPNPRITPVIDPIIVHQLNTVMRKVITHGTGRRAHGELYIDVAKHQTSSPGRYKIRIPSFGKTGSTNDFTTSYFAGFVPYPKDKGQDLNLNNFYTLATYVGYDTPREMKKGRISIYGGTGALPLWTDFFKETMKEKDYESYLDAFDIDIISKKEWNEELSQKHWESIRVDLPRGLVLGKFSDKYIEDYKPTNLSVTGEEFQDIHRISRSIKGKILVPKPFSQKNPIPRMFDPLTEQTIADMGFYYPEEPQESSSRSNIPKSHTP